MNIYGISPKAQNGTLLISSYFLSGTSWDRCSFSVLTSFHRFFHLWASPVFPELIVAPCNSVLTPLTPQPLRQRVNESWAPSPCHSSNSRLLSLSYLSSRLGHPVLVKSLSVLKLSGADQILKLIAPAAFLWALVLLYPFWEDLNCTDYSQYGSDMSLHTSTLFLMPVLLNLNILFGFFWPLLRAELAHSWSCQTSSKVLLLRASGQLRTCHFSCEIDCFSPLCITLSTLHLFYHFRF